MRQRSQRISLDAKVVAHDMKSLLTFSADFIGRLSSDQARQLAILHRRRLSRFAEQAFLIKVNRGNTCAHRTFVSDVPHERACVDAFYRGDVPTFQISVERFLRAPVRSHAACFAHNKTFNPGTVRFLVFTGNTIVPDQRIRHANDLSGVGRVGQYFLVTRHGSIEDHLATRFALSRPRAPAKHATVF